MTDGSAPKNGNRYLQFDSALPPNAPSLSGLLFLKREAVPPDPG